MFEFLVVGWCSASIVVAIGLVVWVVVELKLLGSKLLARRRRCVGLARARTVTREAARTRIVN